MGEGGGGRGYGGGGWGKGVWGRGWGKGGGAGHAEVGTN